VKVAIVNYGMGNLASVRRSLEDLGATAYIADHPAALYEANRIILPGVGAFKEGMARLTAAGWLDVLHNLVCMERRPVLGICLGMQLLAGEGEEGGVTRGLGWIDGIVKRLDQLGCTSRIPHVGWNDVEASAGEPLFANIPQRSDFYFVHSYGLVAANREDVVATATYDIAVAAAVHKHNVFGTQFHPEKSSRAGMLLLRNFLCFVPPC
jgi:imidazole glycerol-phosphate synthase subunit HisH